MERASPVIYGSIFGGEVRRAKRALMFDPAVKAVGSFDLTHQQDMVKVDHYIGYCIAP